MHYKARPDVVITGKEKIQYGKTALLVMRVDYGEKKQTNTLWVNPTPAVDGSITIPPEVPAVRATPMVLSIMSDELILNSSCQGYLDEIRVGTTYHDVAPGWQGIGPQGTLQFSPASYTADEMGGRVAVTVTRIGGSAGPASVKYSTAAGGTATLGMDYTPAEGRLVWAEGDVSPKIFFVKILRDKVQEGEELFHIHLTMAEGAALGKPASASVSILRQ
jgi:hypothetical protein